MTQGTCLDIWLHQNGQKYGPYSEQALRDWVAQGRVQANTLAWHQDVADWTPLSSLLALTPGQPPMAPPVYMPGTADTAQNTINTIAGYEKCSGIIWLILGIIQCLTLVAIIAGVWNILAGISRLRAAPLIQQRHPDVPAAFEGVGLLIAIGLINLFFGGIIGVVAVAFDFFIRDMVLKNRALFDASPQSPAAA